MKLSKIIPSRGRADRATFIGCTGSGKTTLAEKVCSFFEHVIVLDTKGTVDWAGYKLYRKFDALEKATEPKRIFRPDGAWLRSEEEQEKFFAWIYWRQNCVIYIDEASSITGPYQRPDSLFDCIVRGRELGIQVFASTQRPAKICMELLTEAEHVYCFKLRRKNDQDTVKSLCGIDAERIVEKHDFVYSNDGEIVFDKPTRLKL